MISFSTIIALATQHWKITAAASVILVVGIAGCQYRSSLIEKGRQDAIKKIERANEAAKDKATEAERKALACHASGGTWNRGKQRCE